MKEWFERRWWAAALMLGGLVTYTLAVGAQLVLTRHAGSMFHPIWIGMFMALGAVVGLTVEGLTRLLGQRGGLIFCLTLLPIALLVLAFAQISSMGGMFGWGNVVFCYLAVDAPVLGYWFAKQALAKRAALVW